MLQPSIRASARLVGCCATGLEFSFARLRVSRLPTAPSRTTIRHATHKSEGRANGPKNGPGKRMGAKKTGGQYVIPGNILYRQRGTLWYPGENVGLGRDHTLYATAPGYVRYYRDPARHKTRQYIGVVLQKEHRLPVQAGVARRRRLGMYAQRVGGEEDDAELQSFAEADTPAEHVLDGSAAASKAVSRLPGAGRVIDAVREAEASSRRDTPLRLGGPNRKTNWQIGKAMEQAAEKVRPYKKGERFLAWRKRMAGVKRAIAKGGRKGARKGRRK